MIKKYLITVFHLSSNFSAFKKYMIINSSKIEFLYFEKRFLVLICLLLQKIPDRIID